MDDFWFFKRERMVGFCVFFQKIDGTLSNEGCEGLYNAPKGGLGPLGVILGVDLGQDAPPLK